MSSPKHKIIFMHIKGISVHKGEGQKWHKWQWCEILFVNACTSSRMNTKGPSTLLSAHISKASIRVLVHLAWSYQYLKELLMSATIQQLFSFNKTPPNYICITTAWPFCKIACLQSRSVTYWKKAGTLWNNNAVKKIYQFKELLLSMLSLSSFKCQDHYDFNHTNHCFHMYILLSTPNDFKQGCNPTQSNAPSHGPFHIPITPSRP